MVGHWDTQPKESEISQQLEASIVGTTSIDLNSHSPHVCDSIIFPFEVCFHLLTWQRADIIQQCFSHYHPTITPLPSLKVRS
jgi:hypothetical protein